MRNHDIGEGLSVRSEDYVGLPVSGAVLADQVRTIDWRARNLRRICTLPPGITNEVLDKLSLLVERDE